MIFSPQSDPAQFQMTLLLISFALLLVGASLSLILRGRLARWAALLSLGTGCILGLIPAFWVLFGGKITPLHIPWRVPMGEFSLAMDPLSAFFLILIFSICLVAGVYGEGYLEASHGHLPTRAVRFFYFLLTCSMAVLVCAQNAVLFLTAWEVMALSGFFLIAAEDKKPETRRAGILYLICTHIGTSFLIVMFAFMGYKAGSLDFSVIQQSLIGVPEAKLTMLFILALIGFGMKAGFMPLHIWLQEAHPAAPSHASAILSGVMIKMGIYGLLRFIFLCPSVPTAWGPIFLAIGASSGILGIVFAMAQSDLKRLLAYSTIENAGIIAMGMGLGCLGLSRSNNALALIGFTAAILHTLNHGLFKSLLFLGAGAYNQALGSRDIEGAGGLLRRMPFTSLFSWIGAVAVCGLPPLNGFASEWLVYYGIFNGNLSGRTRYGTAGSAMALALIGGLAVACFTKAYGALTLGEPRSQPAENAKDPGAVMLWPMALLAASCLAIGIFPGPVVLFAARPAAMICHLHFDSSNFALQGALIPLKIIGFLGASLLGMTAILGLLKKSQLHKQETSLGPTWACGFTRPLPRMQYTASSYIQPLTRFFGGLLRPETEIHSPSGYWPKLASFRSHTPDPALDRMLIPASLSANKTLVALRRFQQGRLQYYLLSVFLFLIALLLWKL